jgi:hypothetical protein
MKKQHLTGPLAFSSYYDTNNCYYVINFTFFEYLQINFMLLVLISSFKHNKNVTVSY